VRNEVPLPVCTSTVADDELPAAADVPEDAEDEPAPDVDDADDAEPCEPPELQAAARTPAAAIGAPILRASEPFLDANSLFICCAFLSGEVPRR
jgi:hypothetical protein